MGVSHFINREKNARWLTALSAQHFRNGSENIVNEIFQKYIFLAVLSNSQLKC